ncbi:MAG: nuclear transport factor 2 family protein [Nibricoccus sp.]
MKSLSAIFAAVSLILSPNIFAAPTDVASPQATVVSTEAAFAESMAKRDFKKFSEFVSAEAIFFSKGKVLRGKAAVLTEWKSFFVEPQAPFSWKPETVEVLASGNFALSSGPVFDPRGTMIATFTSVWRLESDGHWRIVFDKGNKICPPPAGE